MAAPSTTLVQIWDQLVGYDGLPLVGATVTVQQTYPGLATYNGPTPYLLASYPIVSAVTDATGYWTLNVIANDAINPAGTTYQVRPEGRPAYAITVPSGGVPVGGWKTTNILAVTPPAVAQVVLPSTLNFLIDGSGNLPGTGIKGAVEVDFNATILSAALYADAVGSAVLDIFKSTYAGYPGSGSICAAALPTLAAAQKEKDSTLSGWTTSISAGDVLRFNLVSVASLTQLTLALALRKTV